MNDFKLDLAPNIWVHPETDVRILDEDMPDELRPEPHGLTCPVLGHRDAPWSRAHVIRTPRRLVDLLPYA